MIIENNRLILRPFTGGNLRGTDKYLRMYNCRDFFDESYPETRFYDPNNPGIEQRKRIYKDLTEYRKAVVRDIAKILNDTLKLDFSVRHWEIVMGNWLIRTTDALHYRFEIIRNAITENKFSSIIIFSDNTLDIAPVD